MAEGLAKSYLRQRFLRERQSLAIADWQRKSQQLCSHLQQVKRYRSASTVLAYQSIRQEPDLHYLWHADSSGGVKGWGLPRCEGKALVWHRWEPDRTGQLKSGVYGIPEPRPDLPVLTAAAVDLMLVPAVACDRQGIRLGYGGGYYDRLLRQPDWCAVPTICVVFEFSFVPVLPQDPWDCLVQGVCTETGFYPIS